MDIKFLILMKLIYIIMKPSLINDKYLLFKVKYKIHLWIDSSSALKAPTVVAETIRMVLLTSVWR